MQRAFDHAHHAIFAPHSLSIETKVAFILCRFKHVLLPEVRWGNLITSVNKCLQGTGCRFWV